MNHSDTFPAYAQAALPDIGIDGALPESLQVFPPGKAVKFTLQDYPGQEFELDVDASVAERANEALQSMIDRANAGQGALPFADKNHEDAEACFRPLRYFWGGDDRKTGGVRVVPDWTPFGAELVRAKAFKYFSQNFLFSKAKKKFLGLINENIGGLVNRPGFATQAAFARADISRLAEPQQKTNDHNTMTKEEIQQIGAAVAAAVKPLADRVAAIEGHVATVQGHLGASTLPSRAVKDFSDAVEANAKANGGDYLKALQDATIADRQGAADYLSSMRKNGGAVMRSPMIGTLVGL